MLFFCFFYYVFIDKKQKQLEEHHIFTPLTNYVGLPRKHTNITHLFVQHFNTNVSEKNCHAFAFMLLQLLFIQSPNVPHTIFKFNAQKTADNKTSTSCINKLLSFSINAFIHNTKSSSTHSTLIF